MNKFWKNFFSNPDLYKFVVFIILIIVYFIVNATGGKTFWEAFDLKMLISFVILFLVGLLTTGIVSLVKECTEDRNKLLYDNEEICKKYSRIDMRKTPEGISICGADIVPLYDKELVIEDHPEDRYALPKGHLLSIKDVYDIHGSSTIYNNPVIRVTGISSSEGKVVVSTGRATFFDSLLTNRAMDYVSDKAPVSVRSIYEPGPFLTPLEQSSLANHLGFNGYVETKDGKFIFIKRGNKISVSRNAVQGGVSAGFKAKYCLDGPAHETSAELLLHGIQMEVIDELNLEGKTDIFAKQTISESILYFYRELVEGGKPQFVTYTKLNLTAAEIMACQLGRADFLKDQASKVKTDGSICFFLTREELEDIKTDGNTITIKGKQLKTVPTIAISHVLFMEYLHNTGK